MWKEEIQHRKASIFKITADILGLNAWVDMDYVLLWVRETEICPWILILLLLQFSSK